MTSFLGIKIKAFAGLISDLKYKIIGSLNSDLAKKSVKSISKYVSLNETEWITSQSGKYYSAIQLDIPQNATLIGCSIYSWGGLRENDYLFGYLSSNSGDAGVASNVNSFDAYAYVVLVFMYVE